MSALQLHKSGMSSLCTSSLITGVISVKRHLKTFSFAAAFYSLPCATSDSPHPRLCQFDKLLLRVVNAVYVCAYTVRQKVSPKVVRHFLSNRLEFKREISHTLLVHSSCVQKKAKRQ